MAMITSSQQEATKGPEGHRSQLSPNLQLTCTTQYNLCTHKTRYLITLNTHTKQHQYLYDRKEKKKHNKSA